MCCFRFVMALAFASLAGSAVAQEASDRAALESSSPDVSSLKSSSPDKSSPHVWSPDAPSPSFRVVIPHAGKRELRLYDVGPSGTAMQLADRLSLSWQPAGITTDPAGRVIATGRSATDGRSSEAMAATVLVTARGLQLQRESKLAAATGYTSVDRSGRFLMAAHYKDGRADVYRLQQDGSIGPRTSSVVLPTQAAHSILTTVDNRFAYVPCVKEHNALYQFAFDAARGTLMPLQPFDAGPPALFGPRHLAIHPRLSTVYFSNEQQLGVSVYRVADDGRLTALQHAATRPRRQPYTPGVRGLHASDLVMDQPGERLFVAVRDFVDASDMVYVFRVLADGRLRLTGQQAVGDIPWKVGLSPDGSLLLVSETGDQTLACYRILPDDRLQLAGRLDLGMAARDFVVLSPPDSQE